jgi:hypothetical protein
VTVQLQQQTSVEKEKDSLLLLDFSNYGVTEGSTVFLVHPRLNVIVRFFRVDEGDLCLTQVNYHGSRMPFLNGFAFSVEELHHRFTLSQGKRSLFLKKGVPEKQYIQFRQDSVLRIIALFTLP